MEEWKEYKLGDFMEFNPKISLKKNTVARKITMDQLVPHSRDIYSWVYEPYSGGAKFQNGDTIMARITSCLENGKHAFISLLDENEIAYGSTEYIVIRDRNGVSDNVFVYYLSHVPSFKEAAVKSMVGSSGRQRAQVDVLENLTMKLPSLPEQRKIADTLSKFDDKIAINKRINDNFVIGAFLEVLLIWMLTTPINDNLEQQAQALFKSWFVDFEPFHEQPFVESELGMIPKGWKVGTLSDLGEIVGGSTPSKAKPEFYTDNGIVWLTPKDLSVSQCKFTSRGEIDITMEGYKSCSTKLMPKGTVLFSSRAPIGYITIAKNDICTNQGFKSVIPTLAGAAFLYCLLKESTQEIENKATGSTFKEASSSLMKSLPVIVPEKVILDDFEDLMRPIFKQQEVLEEENSRLSSIRDTLLPRLMSGELKVCDVTI